MQFGGLNVSYGVPFVQNMYTRSIGVSPKWNETFSEFKESNQLLKHKSKGESKGPVFHMRLAGSILVSGTSGGRFEPFYCNDKYFSH